MRFERLLGKSTSLRFSLEFRSSMLLELGRLSNEGLRVNIVGNLVSSLSKIDLSLAWKSLSFLLLLRGMCADDLLTV